MCWSLDWVWGSEDRLGGGWHEPSPGTLILPTGTVTITTLLTFLHFAIVLYCGLLRSRGFFVNFGKKKGWIGDMCVLRICDHVPTHFNFYCDCALVPLLCLLYKHVAIIICLRTTAWMSSRPPALCGCSRLLWSFWAIKINSAYSKKKTLAL